MPRDQVLKKVFEIADDGMQGAVGYFYYVAACQHLSKEQILAMGDNDNDASMLSWAGIGVAVESASDLAKKESNYIAKGVIEGAIEVLRLVRIAKHLTNQKIATDVKFTPFVNGKVAQATINDSVLFNSDSIFIAEDDVIGYCDEDHGVSVDNSKLKTLFNSGLLTVYKYENQNIFLKSDLVSIFPSL